jgi:hypothetical protein
VSYNSLAVTGVSVGTINSSNALTTNLVRWIAIGW